MDWLDDLRKKFNYCPMIEFIPFPSASPEFMEGVRVYCSAYDFDINYKEDHCTNCPLYNKENND